MSSRVLIIVENLTLPLDRRVWQEATTLRDAGYTVSVICPKGGKYQSPYEQLEGIHIFRHPLPCEADGFLGYALEYSAALFWEFALSLKVLWKVGFDSVQACNPPDTIFILGAFYKYLFGKPFIFDHHDINPELYEAKFGKRGFVHKMLHWFERLTFATADVSIATNGAFRDIAINRGGMRRENVYIVRSIPDLKRFKRVAPDASLKKGRKHLIGYVGIMGAQDGIDLFVESMAELVHGQGRDDVQAVIVGCGTELERLKALAVQLQVTDQVTFTGFLSGEALLTAFSTFDIGVIPDPKNVYNDKIAMNKVFEYMTLGIPFAAFELDESMKTAGTAALYARNNDPRDLARRLAEIADQPELAARMAEEGRRRARSELVWEDERDQLLAAYARVLEPRTQAVLVGAEPVQAG